MATDYTFKYAMLHSTSEHTVYGIPYDLELNLFHEGSNSSVVVLTYLYSIGATSGLLGGVVSALKSSNGSMNANAAATINMPWNTGFDMNLYSSPMNASYWHYNGSQSTPPCTGDYRYFVFSNAQSVSQVQYNTLMQMLSNNWRPLQRQNTRTVWYYSGNSEHSVASSASNLVAWWKF